MGLSKKKRKWLCHIERTAEDKDVKKIKDGNPCPKDQLEDPKTFRTRSFGRYKEHEFMQLEECNTEQR